MDHLFCIYNILKYINIYKKKAKYEFLYKYKNGKRPESYMYDWGESGSGRKEINKRIDRVWSKVVSLKLI